MISCSTPRVQSGAVRYRRNIVAAVACTLVCLEVTTVAVAQLRPGGRRRTSPTTAAPVVQYNGSKIQMPIKRQVSRTSGLKLSVDPRWTNGYGYSPVEVTISTISSTKATTADHTIVIQLHTGWNRNMSAEQVFEMPAGSASATTIVAFPSFQPLTNNYFWFEVWVDGVRDKDLSLDQISSISWMGVRNAGGANLAFLTAGSASDNRALVATNALEFQVLTLELPKFPSRWIDYTALDVVTLSLSEARQLQQQQPAAFEAICHWVHAGGQLWISDAGANLEELPAVSKLFHLSVQVEPDEPERTADEKPEKADAKTDAAKAKNNEAKSDDKSANAEDVLAAPVGWHALHFRGGGTDGQVVTFRSQQTGLNQTVRDPERISRLKSDPNYTVVEERFDPTIDTNSDKKPAKSSSPWYLEQSMGLGTVRAFRGENEVENFATLTPAANPNAVANSDAPDDLNQALSMGLRRIERWDARHGMTPDSANLEFVKLLVPGVGLAPVTEFEILITVFVLIIGPLNYWWLRRFKRLHLMVLTVPLAATVTTLALFGYAIVADGFATRVRVYSYTMLDQRTGEAACWSRLSYYAGLSPANGLTMPNDVAIYPVQPVWTDDDNLREIRTVVWSGNEELLTRGWLNSRTPTQYLTVRSRKSPHQLEVLDGGDKVRVKNQLGTKIRTLVLISESGKLFLGDEIADAAGALLQPVERADAVRRISRLISDNMPKAPDALATNDADLSSLVVGRDTGDMVASARNTTRHGYRIIWPAMRSPTWQA